MAYKESIAVELRKLYENAQEGTSEYTLEHFDQQDVADTVNNLNSKYPDTFQKTFVDYSNKAIIEIVK